MLAVAWLLLCLFPRPKFLGSHLSQWLKTLELPTRDINQQILFSCKQQADLACRLCLASHIGKALWAFPTPENPNSTTKRLLPSILSRFSRLKLYRTLRRTPCGSNQAPQSNHVSHLCVCYIHMSLHTQQLHGTRGWTNDLSSGKLHTHTLECFPVSHTEYTRGLTPFCWVAEVSPLSLCRHTCSPALGACSWTGLKSLLRLSSGFCLSLSSLTPWFLAYSLSQVPIIPSSSSSPSCRSFYNWACSLAGFPSEQGPLPMPFRPYGPWTGLFSLEQTQTVAFPQRGVSSPCCFLPVLFFLSRSFLSFPLPFPLLSPFEINHSWRVICGFGFYKIGLS